MNNILCDKKAKQKCDSFYKQAFLERGEYIKNLELENQQLNQKEKILIKYLEDNIKEDYIGGADICSPCRFKERQKVYQDILERLKNNNYE